MPKQYIQITAGRGPAECARAVALVAREMLKAIPGLTVADSEPHNRADGCFMSVTLTTDKPVSPDVMAQWRGTVLWRSTSNPFRPGHRRCNWFVGIDFFDEVSLPVVKESDIVYETCRSGGNGGQNVNKVESAVRAIHRPSGVAVKCSDERSQSRNKAIARERLLLKLKDRGDRAEAEARSVRWSAHDSLERGNPVRIFSGPL